MRTGPQLTFFCHLCAPDQLSKLNGASWKSSIIRGKQWHPRTHLTLCPRPPLSLTEHAAEVQHCTSCASTRACRLALVEGPWGPHLTTPCSYFRVLPESWHTVGLSLTHIVAGKWWGLVRFFRQLLFTATINLLWVERMSRRGENVHEVVPVVQVGRCFWPLD